jgi:two-component system, NarL family, nitrate/nitrite response regulator NarL
VTWIAVDAIDVTTELPSSLKGAPGDDPRDDREGWKVAVVGATRAYAEALGAVLEQAGFEVFAVANRLYDILERLESLESLPVDVVVLDLGSENHRAIRALTEAASVRVLVLGMPAAEAEIVACARAGASGFFGHDGSLEELAGAIGTVARGEVSCSPEITALLLGKVSVDAASSGARVHLTQREAEILALVDEGLSNKQIAQRLQIEVATVKNHVHNVLSKLNVHGRFEAAARLRLRHSDEPPAARPSRSAA